MTILIFFDQHRSVLAFLVFGMKPMRNEMTWEDKTKESIGSIALLYNFRRRRQFSEDNRETEYMNSFPVAVKYYLVILWGTTVKLGI